MRGARYPSALVTEAPSANPFRIPAGNSLTCEPPKGHKRWTLKLLEAAVVELSVVKRASDNTIERVLKKDILKPHSQDNGSSRPMPTLAS
jgi:hypothetical protein